ncbi:AGAP007530-PA-like protein [Anopheles sinensis]|uniref:AGAP007530-PA-like protein n=1 Tax=Anopheles sinensis TaxID=74873 RepID=A0A084WNF7_ANOSI|nr:AGAP007530-PA-like protein [Anopheles sinensis]
MMVDNFECAGYTFYSKFDSGNLGKVELVRCCEGLGIVGNTVSTSVTGGNGSTNIAGVPVITTGGSTNGGQQSIGTTANTTSASAIVAATLGVGVALSTTTATTAGSGTLGLPIPSPTPHATENPLVEVEFNLWTRPDCAGTPYENQNRTWFHFAVTGGRPNQIVKFNVMNLNKQAKLFSQGMHPVTKVGPNGRWERIKDKPSYSITNDVFFISFLHKAPEVATEQTKIYYAFTFPFTYTELLDQLATFDRKYGRHPFELNKMAYDISQKYDTSTSGSNSSSGPGGEESKGISNLSHRRKKGRLSKMERVDRTSDPESFDETARDGTAVAGDDGSGRKPSVAPPTKEVLSEVAKTLQATLGTAGGSMVIDENTSESMQAITNLVNNVKIELPAGGQKPQAQASTMTTSKLKLPSFHNQLTGAGTSSGIAPTTDDDSKSDARDEIYYCRELLTHSVERRRIELLTISSFHGIQTAREARLRNLFPDEDAQRCHTFRDKKIVFISSRVHPGETPASFVLNGFLSMLLDRKSVISQTLRRMYVFKIIPFLNPDGVYNGLYRSDTRGHNLNRVYIAPCHETQPAIYAARKLISEASTASSKVVTMSSISSVGSTPPEDDGKTASVGEVGSLAGAPQPPSLAVAAATAVAAGAGGAGGGKVFTEKLIPELNPVVVGETAVRPMGGGGRSASSTSLISSGSLTGKKSIHSVQAKVDSGKGGSKGGGKQHVALNKPQFIGSTPAGTLKLKEFLLHPHHHHHHHHHHHPHHHHHHHQTGPAGGLAAGSGAAVAAGGSVQGQAVLHGGKMSLGALKKATAGHKKDASSSASSSARAPTGSSILGETAPGGGKNLRPQTPQTQPQFSHYRSHRNEYLGPGVGIGGGAGAGSGVSQRNLNISLDFLAQLDERNDRVVYEDRSNLFMYIDLHGHASKKGVFMYGNHLPSTVEAVECMLLPRLMSLNSQHFHFDACNFSERNMYYKGKRDGLSKEGSGRVAVYKSTGLIKSYTLECNYNTGKCVNILPPRGKEIVAKTTHTLVPPKYVPAVFEEVGKALGPSILDLTNSNPLSRLPNCEFRTLQGLRNALRIEIERGSSKARVTNKVICCPRAALLFADAFQQHHQLQHQHQVA